MLAQLFALALASVATPAHGNVPFVGCPADGQVGPMPAPRPRRTPVVPAAAARRLAYYASADMAVLAPRGWHCLEVYGSNGGTLVVAPGQLGPEGLTPDHRPLRGPAVTIGYADGGTSGRFAVVGYVARYFPRYRAYIGRVRRMGFQLGPIASGPYPGDRIRSRTATRIRLTTPAGQRGAGAAWWLAPDRDPVESLILLNPAGDMGVTDVKVRLPRNQADLAPIILAQARR